MSHRIYIFLLFLSCVCIGNAQQGDTLIYHRIQADRTGKIIPWYKPDPGASYNHVINLVWQFWDTMRRDMNGIPYYMNHQVWNPAFNDPRGIGGDQFAMALSSWRLYYAYSGNERVKENMAFMADYYLTHGLSPAGCQWPSIPFPYNCLIYSGVYDGDMRNGKDYAQPDKAGSFGLELVHLYKIKDNRLYLDAAIRIANTLCAHLSKGDSSYSPLPFKVNVYSGATGMLRNHDFTGTWIDTAGYTSNWAPTMQLLLDLSELGAGDTATYQKAFNHFLQWMKQFPMALNKWGPFFEDVDWWSETQINAMTFARFIMEHPQYFPDWKKDTRKIIDWVHQHFSNHRWERWGVTVTNEQTVYQTPANSHSSRQAADELLYTVLSGDSSLYDNAVRELHWATYMVDSDGKNKFPFDEPWLTDGYGDYVRHYLRAMDAVPALSFAGEDHILSSSSVIQQADYASDIHKVVFPDYDPKLIDSIRLFYRCFDSTGTEKIRLRSRPGRVLLDGQELKVNSKGEGIEWVSLQRGGVLIVRRLHGKRVMIMK